MTASESAQLRSFTFDAATQLKDAGAITASAAAQVGGADKILDLGDAFVEGSVVADISAIDFGTEDETYEIQLQFSDVADFSTGTPDIHAVSLPLGDARNGMTDQAKVGRKVIPFNNRFVDANGAPKNYRYMRAYTVAGGDSPSIDYVAYVVKQ